MTISGQALPQAGAVLSGQQSIASVIVIDGESAAMAFVGACPAPAIKPMIARIGSSRLSALNKPILPYLMSSGAETRRCAVRCDHNPIISLGDTWADTPRRMVA